MVRTTSQSDRNAFQDSVAMDLHSSGSELSAETVQNVAFSVAEYCDQYMGSFLLPIEYYGLILSRSLWGVGEVESACQMLDKWCESEVAQVCDPFLRWGVDTERLWAACSRGVVRRESRAAIGGDGAWIIDLERMTWSKEDLLELAVFESVNIILDRIAHVWDSQSGSGRLTIYGLSFVCTMLLGAQEKRRVKSKSRQFVQDVLAFSRMALTRQASLRQWQRVPNVINASITI